MWNCCTRQHYFKIGVPNKLTTKWIFYKFTQ